MTSVVRRQIPRVGSGKPGRCWLDSAVWPSALRLSSVSGLRFSRATGRWSASQVRNSRSQRRGIATSNLSYSEGPKEPALLQQTIPEHFATIVSRYGDQPAFIARAPAIMDATPPPTSSISTEPETKTLTYESLDSLSNTLARSLQSLGVKKGDRVAVSLGNVLEHVALMYAIFKLGAILVPLNPNFNSNQVGAALSYLGVEVFIIGAVTDLAYRPCRGRSNLELLSSLIPNLTGSKIESPAVPTLKSVVIVDNTASHPQAGFPPLRDLPSLLPYTTLLSSSSTRPVTPDSPLSPDDTINIQYTSGTTSMPKAAMLSHTSILNNGRFIASRMGLDPTDRIVCPPPLFHCFGCVIGVQATVTTGSALLFASPAFDPAANLAMAAAHRATGLYGVSTMFVAELELLAHPGFAARLQLPGGTSGLDRLRKGVAAGSSVPEPLMARLIESLGLTDLVICYGMTETGPVSVMTAPDDPREKRTGSVGRVMPHTAVKVVEPGDRSRIVPRGERGELATSGYLVMRGYWGDEARTAEDLIVEDEDEDGEGDGEGMKKKKRAWMYTGDEAVMDDEGYIEITGRIKDLIIRGGENIHPLEVENCLFRHPLVREASVVGVPDERHGEVVGAFVVPHDGVRVADGKNRQEMGGGGEGGEGKVLSREEVTSWVRRSLSSHLVPRYVFWIDEFPKTASGKIQKYKLRDMAKKLVSEGGG